MLDKIANEIVLARAVIGSNSVDRIAEVLGYSPVLLINALYDGVASGKLIYSTKHRTVDIADDVEVASLLPSESFLTVPGDIDLREQIELLIRNLNSGEADMAVEELWTWLPGSGIEKLKMLILIIPALATYELPDPVDKKSVYMFITLKENAGKQWGKKQFGKGKAAKRIKKATSRT